MRKPIQKNDVVAVDFLDHVEDGDEPIWDGQSRLGGLLEKLA
jgi:hypothetical protein